MSEGRTPSAETGSTTRVDDRRPAYDGGVLELLPIVLVNSVLTILTLGLYRFWAKTRVRRYFLSRISFLGDRLVYTGTGKELFIGFLIVLAFIVPFGIVFQTLSHWAEGQGWVWFGTVNVAYFITLYYLIQFAVFRANRYRLSRATWRGIRAGQTGSALRYANLAMLYSLLVPLSLGLAYPLMRNRLQAYKIDHASFGSERFSYSGQTGPLFRRWLVPWGVFMATMLIGAVWASLSSELSYATKSDMELADFRKLRESTPALVSILAFLLFYLSMFWYRAAEIRHFTNHTEFAGLRFASTLRGTRIFLVYLFYVAIFAVLIVPGVFLALAAGGVALSEGTVSDAASAIGSAAVLVYVLFFFVIAGPLQTLVVQNLLLRIFCNALTIDGHIASERLLQSQLEMPTRGEGLADALDIDAF